MTREELLRQSKSIRKHIGELLEQGAYIDPAFKIVRFCKNLLECFNAI